ncbi:MAG: glycerol-3-phosphate 1-O-acyltransferase PlsY [Candidatus Omnitrophota bacterium]
MLWILLAIAISYLIGSIPTAYIFGRCLKGIDIRTFGSGNVGATNASRLLGKKTGIIVLILDILKGLVTVILLGDLALTKSPHLLDPALLRIIIGLGCIAGHNWTIFLNFKGGKGVATTLGVLLGSAWVIPGISLVLVLVILTWIVSFLATRIISLASLLAAISFPAYMVLKHRSPTLILSSFILSIFIIVRHIPNIKRILQKKEPRMSFKKQ